MIAIGCDHGGYALKKEIINYLNRKGLKFRDFGTFSEESVDYPIYAAKVAKAVVSGECDRGLLLCGTGIGISIAANKVKGIRAAACSEVYSAEMSRRHNNANILALGGRVLSPEKAVEIVDVWLNTEFEGGRHQRRVDLITEIEKESCDM